MAQPQTQQVFTTQSPEGVPGAKPRPHFISMVRPTTKSFRGTIFQKPKACVGGTPRPSSKRSERGFSLQADQTCVFRFLGKAPARADLMGFDERPMDKPKQRVGIFPETFPSPPTLFRLRRNFLHQHPACTHLPTAA